MQWQVQLEGDSRDLEYLARTFESGPRRVLRDQQGPGYVYESDSFSSCTESEHVERIAEDELAALSGILKLERGARERLRYGAVYRPNPNGGRDIFVSFHESVHVRVEMGAVTAVVTDEEGNVITRPSPPPRAVVLSQLTTSDFAVAKAMRLLGSPDVISWVGLYRLYEVVEDDSGGESALKKRGWGSSADLKRFKHSANSVQVGGDKSRHGKEPQTPPRNPMTLAEVEAYVKYVVQSWLAAKGA